MTCWHLYILQCDQRLYTGISTDPIRRYYEHLSGGSRAARFTRGATYLELKYSVPLGDKRLALRAEYHLKQLTRSQKLTIIEDQLSAAELMAQLGLSPE